MPKTTAEISAALAEYFPQELVKTKNNFDFVGHEHYRDRLIEATDNCFDWKVEQVIFHQSQGEIRRVDRETQESTYPVAMIVVGTLTIPGLGSRSGVGVHPLDTGAGEDAAYKSADSDALKRAAMAFGVGLKQFYIEGKGGGQTTQSRTTTSSAAPQTTQTRESTGAKSSATISRPNDPASAKQMEYIESLFKKTPWEFDQFDWDGTTKGEASVWIESLNKGELPEGVDDPNS